MTVTVGSQPLLVTSLGRIAAPGNVNAHTVKLVTAATGIDVPGGSASVSTAGATTGTFVYTALPSAVTLNANTTYYVLSQETSGGDQWYDYNTFAQCTPDGVLGPAVYSIGSYYVMPRAAGYMFAPVDFKYTTTPK